MNRLAVITVGKTHSGKTTFAKALENELANSIVIDQDVQAEILQSYYPALVPEQGPNLIKMALTRTIVDCAVDQTDCHIILSNSNRNRQGRLKLLEFYKEKGFTTILVNFDIKDETLEERIQNGGRSTEVLRTVNSFTEVLERQQIESRQQPGTVPTEDEADQLFHITHEDVVDAVVSKILRMAD